MNARPLSSHRAERWAAQLEFIRGSLARDPEATQAWLWQIRERVLTYLLARYAGDQGLDSHLPAAPNGAVLPPRVERKTAEPRPAAILGEHLQRIAAANMFSEAEQIAFEQQLERQLRWQKIKMRLVIPLVMGGVFLLLRTIFLAPSGGPECFLSGVAAVLCATLAAACASRRRAKLSASTPRAPRDSFRA